MKIYKCYRCGYENHIKTHFMKHLNRLKICKPKLEDITIEDVKIQNGLEIVTKSTKNPPKITTTPPKSTTKHQNPPKVSYECEYCNKEFSRSDSLKRHIDSRCQEKDNIQNQLKEKDEEIKKIKEEKDFLLEIINEQSKQNEEVKKEMMEEMKKQIEMSMNNSGGNNETHNQSHNTNTNSLNTQNTNSHNTQITINSYGKEDIKHITPKYLSGLLKYGPRGAIPKLTKEIHFNDNIPENKNMKITNKKMPYISVYKDDRWFYRDKEEVIQEIIDDKFDIIDTHYDEQGKEKLNTRQNDRYMTYKREMNENKVNDTQKFQKKELDLLILNYSKK